MRRSHVIFHSEPGTYLSNHQFVHKIWSVPSVHICIHQCAADQRCTSINYVAPDGLCELNTNHRTFSKPEVHYDGEAGDNYMHYYLV